MTTIDNIRSQNSLMAFKDGNGPPQHSYLLIWQIAPEDTVATSGEQFFLIHTTHLPCSIRLKMLSVMIFFFCSREGFWAEVALVLLLTAASKIICTAGTWLGSLLLLPVHSTYTLEPIRRTGQGFMSCSKVVYLRPVTGFCLSSALSTIVSSDP